MARLRILCLHGFRQNAIKFRGKTGALRRVLHKIADLDYVEGTVQLLPLSAPEGTELSERPRQLAWWDLITETGEYRGWRDSVNKAYDFIRENGPYDGILGFSQGAAMASLLCALQYQQSIAEVRDPTLPEFKFAIMCGGFIPRDPEIRRQYPPVIRIPSLHIIGDIDETVRPRTSMELADRFENADVYRHAAGHHIPTNSPAARHYRQFLSRFLTPSHSSNL